ncbi:E3 binding domain-containing protein [Micromonospora sp. NPDC049230]|uniref:E3 binding domain-containing protein n=1 Tax=Micromonospora sp. NPDC049230 TaxID=3155502 RepID=UPI0033C3AE9F
MDGVLRALSGDGPVAPAGRFVAPADPARVFSSPLARRMAWDGGLTPADLSATGPDGRIVRRDVENALARQNSGTVKPAPAPAALTPVIPEGAVTVPHTKAPRMIETRLAGASGRSSLHDAGHGRGR